MPKIKHQVTPVELEEEFLPGIRAVYGKGHKIDHSALLISSQGESLLHIGDAILHPLQASYPGWMAKHDRLPDQTESSRRALIERSVIENALVFAAHLVFPGLGRFEEAGDAWRWVATVKEKS